MTKIQKILTTLTMTFFAQMAFAQSTTEAIGQKIDSVFGLATGWFVKLIFAPIYGTGFPWIVLWLVVGATVFTLYFAFVQFRNVRLSIDIVKGKYSNPDDAGEVSHFQALATALSGTVGLGNIAGVAVAVSIGGAGATFWMILAGLLGMASKFVECTLGVKYRNEYPDGTVSGGPMYYIPKGFKELGLPGGKPMAVLFAILCVLGSFGIGNMFQANQAHAMITGTFGDYSGLWSGIVFALITFLVVVGGIKSIANVTEKLVPFMGVLYCGAALVVLLMNFSAIPAAFGAIFAGAFTGAGVTGGVVGALIQGFKRATFSNEAGVGSAAIAHSAVKTNEPITEGLVSLLEPFIDTVVICTMTALVIIITGQLMVDPATGNYILNEAGNIATASGASGVGLTSAAFGSQISWFPYVLTVAVVLFAFSTMISWSYYGVKAWTYLFGEGRTKQIIYNIIFCLMIIVGTTVPLSAAIDFSDASVLAMAVVNIAALYFLMPIVKRELHSFLSRVKSGEIKKYK